MLRRIPLLAWAVLVFGLASAPAVAIVGGQLADPGEYPWMAALYFGSNPSTGQYCGGSLVAPRFVVTAAHCMSFSGLGAAHAVDETLFGGGNVLLGQNNLNGAGGERIRVVRYHIHPDYNSEFQTDHDVAVLELQTPSAQTPIAWATPTDAALYAPGTTSTATGWGRTSEGGSSSNALREVDMPIISDTDCDNAYGGDVHVETQVCAGLLGTGGKDTCQGDSGGPLMVAKPGGGKLLVGLTSWGIGCARPQYPGVYTEVASVSAFIDQWVS